MALFLSFIFIAGDVKVQNQGPADNKESSTAKHKSREELETILRNDPHVTYYEPCEQWVFPQTDYSNFNDSDRSMAETLVGLVQLDLSAAYIVIEFDDHADRRKWIDKMTSEHGGGFTSLVEANILRVNILGRLAGRQMLEPLMRAYQGGCWAELRNLSSEAARSYETVSGFERPYDRLAPEEKVAFARSLKNCYFKILQVFAEKKRMD